MHCFVCPYSSVVDSRFARSYETVETDEYSWTRGFGHFWPLGGIGRIESENATKGTRSCDALISGAFSTDKFGISTRWS